MLLTSRKTTLINHWEIWEKYSIRIQHEKSFRWRCITNLLGSEDNSLLSHFLKFHRRRRFSSLLVIWLRARDDVVWLRNSWKDLLVRWVVSDYIEHGASAGEHERKGGGDEGKEGGESDWVGQWVAKVVWTSLILLLRNLESLISPHKGNHKS